jgi:hypothetical protein
MLLKWENVRFYFVSSIFLCQNQIDRMPRMTES